MDPRSRRSRLDELRALPDRVATLVARVPAEAIARRPSPDAFSAREQVHHLRDIDAEGFALRLRRMLDEIDPFLPDVDGGKLAVERRYNERPHEPAFADLAATRAACVARLERMTDAEWARAGTLEGVGRVTVEDLVERWLAHDRAHLGELRALAGDAPEESVPWGHELALR